MNWELWWFFATAGFFLDLTPGPAVLLVLATSLRQGAKLAVSSILGILSANALYFGLSATSVGAMLAASDRVFLVAKWVGAGYLVYLGVQSLFARASVLERTRGDGHAPGRLYSGAFLTQASNPKAIVFFGAFVPQFIDRTLPVFRQMAILAVTSTVIEFLVLLGYALVAERASAMTRRPNYLIWTNRVAGLLLISAGVGIVLLRR